MTGQASTRRWSGSRSARGAGTFGRRHVVRGLPAAHRGDQGHQGRGGFRAAHAVRDQSGQAGLHRPVRRHSGRRRHQHRDLPSRPGHHWAATRSAWCRSMRACRRTFWRWCGRCRWWCRRRRWHSDVLFRSASRLACLAALLLAGTRRRRRRNASSPFRLCNGTMPCPATGRRRSTVQPISAI